MLSAATNDRARALRRRRGAISGSYEDDRKEFNSVDDSGYDGEDNLELTHHFSDLPNATSPESYFTSADNEEQTFHSELTEPVARKRAKKACDYCRAKKCKARPNIKRVANVSALVNHSAPNVGRANSFVTSRSIPERVTSTRKKICLYPSSPYLILVLSVARLKKLLFLIGLLKSTMPVCSPTWVPLQGRGILRT